MEIKITNETKLVDIRLAMYIAMHASIRAIDHLGELLNIVGKELNWKIFICTEQNVPN